MNKHMRWGLVLGCAASLVHAQNTLDNESWTEEAVSVPTSFSSEKLALISMPSYVTSRIGIDPQTLRTGSDGVVRYVVVMQNATGTVNASYEGIRCFSGDVKTYARWTSAGTWNVLANPEWRALNDNMPSRHAIALARQGACTARSANAPQVILDLLKKAQTAER
jgi:CNP1-like family